MQSLTIKDMILIGVVVSVIWLFGPLLTKWRERLSDSVDVYLSNNFSEDVVRIFRAISSIVFYEIVALNLLHVVVLLIILLYILRRAPLRKGSQSPVIFSEKFTNESPYKWQYPYYGSARRGADGIQIKDGILFASADTTMWLSKMNFENGASIDLHDGIKEGVLYQVKCHAKSTPVSTIKFQLWVHDHIGEPPNNIREPKEFETPPTVGKFYSLNFRATKTNLMRIHLHFKAGSGHIHIDSVTVTRLS